MTTLATPTGTAAPDALARGLAALAREMALCELTPGPAPWLRAECVEIDRQVCADSECDRCGHAGLLYKPYHHCRGRRAYVAYSLCPQCGDWAQFNPEATVMTRKKTADPKLIALLDRLDKFRADFERSYARLKRAFTRMEKARRGVARLTKQLASMDQSELARLQGR